jgi:hypothetical protein
MMVPPYEYELRPDAAGVRSCCKALLFSFAASFDMPAWANIGKDTQNCRKDKPLLRHRR